MPINQYILSRVETGLTYGQAQALAVARGATLAAITDAPEEALVESLLALDPLAWSFEPKDNAYNGPWIGLTQAPGSAEPGGGWAWATGEIFTYSHWHAGQPDNHVGDDKAFFWNQAGSIGWADHVSNPVAAGYGPIKTALIEVTIGVNRLAGTAGHDLIWAGDLGNRVAAGAGNDMVYGNGGRDGLFGAAGHDLLDGGLANDTLDGGSGNDTLIGGTGLDQMTGGTGADVFRFVSATDSRAQVAFADIIFDYDKSQGDRIDLSAIDAIPGGSDDAFKLLTGAFDAPGQLRIRPAGADTAIELNLDGDAAVEMTILLSNSFTAADLVFDL